MNFDLSEITELVKNENKTLDAFFASHDVQKNESQPRLKTASNLVRVLTLIRFLSDSFIYQMLALFWPMSEKKQISSLSLTHTHTHTALVFITDFGSLATLLKIQEWEWGCQHTLYEFPLSLIDSSLVSVSSFLPLPHLLIFSGTIWILIFSFRAIQPDMCVIKFQPLPQVPYQNISMKEMLLSSPGEV